MESKESNKSIPEPISKTIDKHPQPSSSGTLNKTQRRDTAAVTRPVDSTLSFAESVTSLQGDMNSLKSELDQLKELSSSLTHILGLMEKQERVLKGDTKEERVPRSERTKKKKEKCKAE